MNSPISYWLEHGNLERRDAEARVLSEELIRTFVASRSRQGMILWSKEDTRARSGVATQPRRPDLRIDLYTNTLP